MQVVIKEREKGLTELTGGPITNEEVEVRKVQQQIHGLYISIPAEFSEVLDIRKGNLVKLTLDHKQNKVTMERLNL